MSVADWHLVARSPELRPGDNVVAAWAGGRELALWRSADGTAQAWDNRCPHRSVRLTLGRVVGDRLACAYHGWQWQAGSGACAGIPAHPGLQPPSVAVAVHTVREQAGLVWVALETPARGAPPADAVPDDWLFCRALPVCVGAEAAEAGLAAAGWTRAGAAWTGHLADVAAHARLLRAQAGLSIVWLWIDAAPHSAAHLRALVGARALRLRLDPR